MEFDCLAPNEIPGVTPLYSAYLTGAKRLSEFYAYPPTLAAIGKAARELKRGKRYTREMRGAVADILTEQNSSLANGELPESVKRNLESLREGAVAVVTGQQAGLFGGPAYTVYKALSALRIVQELHHRGVEAVPIFWVASEDHDLAEVSHCDWATSAAIERFDLAEPAEAQGRSVGRVKLGDEVTAVVKKAAEALEGADAQQIGDALLAAYQSEKTFGRAFAELLAGILAPRGLILLDPLEARLHKLSASVMAKAAGAQQELSEALTERGKQLTHLGYHAQVKVTANTTLLFGTVDGKRVAIRKRNDHFTLGDRALSSAELVAEIESKPEDFSPNALLRPVVQDNLLPTVAYVAGPAEVAYFAQSQVIYGCGLAQMPVIVPRASFTLIESGVGRLLEKYKLSLADVLSGKQHLRKKMESNSLSRGLETIFARGEADVQKILRVLAKPLARTDKTLAGALDTAERKMLYQFNKLKGKAARAIDFRDGVLTRHERTIGNMLYPHAELQERELSFLPFLSRQGNDLVDALLKHSGIGAPAHQIVRL
jgi:bacillithiol synthase